VLTKYLISQINPKRLVIIDPHFEYNDFITVYNFEDAVSYMETHKEFRLSCRFDNDNDIDFLFDAIFYIKNLLLVVEESELYISPYEKSSNFIKLINHGRHSDIGIIAIARRSAELSTAVKGNVDKIYCLLQVYPRDIKNMYDLGLLDVDKLAKFDYIKDVFPKEDIHYKAIIY